MVTPAPAAPAKGSRDAAHARDVGRGGGPQQGRLGVAVDAAQGDLARGRLDFGPAAPIVLALAPLGRLDLELGALVKRLVALQVRPVGVAPGRAAVVVHVARRAKRHDERRRLHVVELGHVGGQDVDQLVRDARQHDTLDVTHANGLGDLVGEPGREVVVVKVAHGDKGAVAQGQGPLACDEGPVARRDEGRDGAQVRVGLGGDDFVKVEWLLLLFIIVVVRRCTPSAFAFAASACELEREGDEEELWVGFAAFFEDPHGFLRIAPEQGEGRHPRVPGGYPASALVLEPRIGHAILEGG